jgi:hypothetical protein
MALIQIAIAVDQLANTLIGGMADETISARAWREQWKFRYVLDFIFGKGHCFNSFVSELERNQLPKKYKKGQ